MSNANIEIQNLVNINKTRHQNKIEPHCHKSDQQSLMDNT